VSFSLRKINLIFDQEKDGAGGERMGYDAFEIVGDKIVYYSSRGQSISYDLKEGERRTTR
jgi:hypothetical protein